LVYGVSLVFSAVFGLPAHGFRMNMHDHIASAPDSAIVGLSDAATGCLRLSTSSHVDVMAAHSLPILRPHASAPNRAGEPALS